MAEISFKKIVKGDLEDVVSRVTTALGQVGFGVLTRIDFHAKLKEKTGHSIPPTVILGACHPMLAYQAYSLNTDVSAVMPCNAVVRELGPKQMSVEFTSAEALLKPLGDRRFDGFSREVDSTLKKALQTL